MKLGIYQWKDVFEAPDGEIRITERMGIRGEVLAVVPLSEKITKLGLDIGEGKTALVNVLKSEKVKLNAAASAAHVQEGQIVQFSNIFKAQAREDGSTLKGYCTVQCPTIVKVAA